MRYLKIFYKADLWKHFLLSSKATTVCNAIIKKFLKAACVLDHRSVNCQDWGPSCSDKDVCVWKGGRRLCQIWPCLTPPWGILSRGSAIMGEARCGRLVFTGDILLQDSVTRTEWEHYVSSTILNILYVLVFFPPPLPCSFVRARYPIIQLSPVHTCMQSAR